MFVRHFKKLMALARAPCSRHKTFKYVLYEVVLFESIRKEEKEGVCKGREFQRRPIVYFAYIPALD
jgi:hypothetical protein